MDIQKLYEKLKSINEPKGFYFNPDSELVFDLLESLIINKQRYGYMACPCRLASGERSKDRDIICPCEYRDADVAEYGTCYCGLYVSKEFLDGGAKDIQVPERRPVEKMW